MEITNSDKRPVHFVALAIGVVFLAAYFLMSRTAQDIAYPAAALAAAVAIAYGARRNGAPPKPWILLAASQSLWALGDASYLLYPGPYSEIPFPSIADAFYLAAYPVLGASLWLLARKSRERDYSFIDAAIIATGLGVVAWVLFMAPYAYDPSLGLAERIVYLTYPLLDLMVLGIGARFLLRGHSTNRSYQLLGLGVGALVVGDIVYGIAGLTDSYETGHPADAAWLISYLLLAMAALHPAMRTVADEFAPTVDLSRRRLLLLTGASLLAPAILFFQGMLGLEPDVPVIAAGATVLFLLVITRMSLMVRDVQGKVVELDEQQRALRDALDGRELLEKQLRHLAFHDSLTGLANRALFAEQVDAALARSRRSGERMAVMLIDLDHFKLVNDSLGHEAGDNLLIVVAARIKSCLREMDGAARLGGDEFAVFLERIVDQDQPTVIAGRLVEAMQAPVGVGGAEVAIQISVGIAISDRDTKGVDELLRQADIAMYEAKRQGSGHFVRYEPGMRGPRAAERPRIIRVSP